MIKIGEMAKICGVSIQTLRYYDKLGLLCADYVDTATGYRYYGPDKIERYRMIAELKAIDFSLDEIGAFLAADPQARLLLYGRKKEELEERLHRTGKKLRRIESAAVEENGSVIPLNKGVLEMPFTDDPAVIGRWDYLGDLPEGVRFSGESVLVKGEITPSTLFFLPGGGHVWTYFWTKGILYVLLIASRLYVPNEYRLLSRGGATYLLLNWMVDKCRDINATGRTCVYKQVDTRIYSERETHLFDDDTSVPYIPDGRVVGCWEAIDIISQRTDFSKHRRSDPKCLITKELEFLPSGICVKRSRTVLGEDFCPQYCYTRGKILNSRDGVAEEYEHRTEDGVEYLIVQHKSADYSYLGRVGCYYVFKRKSSVSEEDK